MSIRFFFVVKISETFKADSGRHPQLHKRAPETLKVFLMAASHMVQSRDSFWKKKIIDVGFGA